MGRSLKLKLKLKLQKLHIFHMSKKMIFSYHDEWCFIRMNFRIEKTNINGSVESCISILLIGSKEKKGSFSGNITTTNNNNKN